MVLQVLLNKNGDGINIKTAKHEVQIKILGKPQTNLIADKWKEFNI